MHPPMGNTVLIHVIGQKPRTELNVETFVLFMNYNMTLDATMWRKLRQTRTGSFLQDNQNRWLNPREHLQALLQTEAHNIFLKLHPQKTEI